MVAADVDCLVESHIPEILFTVLDMEVKYLTLIPAAILGSSRIVCADAHVLPSVLEEYKKSVELT
jgi:hypothetical protein